MIGKTVSHYRILEKIGQGGMGVVYKAEDIRLKRTVALKFLPPQLLGNDTEKARFVHEAQAAAALHHPNICTIHEFDDVDGQTFIVMAYVEGLSLKKKIEDRPLAVADAVRYAIQIGNGLKEAHANDVIHRDVKSANVVVSAGDHAVVLDFGLAKLKGLTRVTREGTTVGTVAYMSPEQARGEDVDRRSDVWSLGVVLFEMLTGRLPFKGEHEAAVVYAIMNENSEPVTALRSGIPMGLERIIEKAMSKDPAERYQSVDEMLVDLKSVQKCLRQPSHAGSKAPAKRRGLFGYVAGVIALVAIVFAVYTWMAGRRGVESEGVPDRTSVAVLPLDNLSNDPDKEFFADGMTEALITQLAQIGALKVISRTSVMQYKDSKLPLKEIARDLNVGAIVEGSVLLAGDRVRITAQLIDASTDEHLWAASYDRGVSDVLAIHSEVAMSVAEAVRAELTSDETSRLEHTKTVDPVAYQLYLRGRYFWNKRTEPDLLKSAEHFKRAIEIDPDYAQAYSGVAAAYAVMATYGAVKGKDIYPHARDYANKAIEIDPGLSEAYAVLGAISVEYDWEWEKAEAFFRKAIALNPSDAVAHQWYAEFLHSVGRWDEAMDEIRIARRLDPLSLIVGVVAATITFNAVGFEECKALLNQVLEQDSDFQIAWLILAIAYAQEGLHDESKEAWLRYTQLIEFPQDHIDTLRAAYDRGGYREFYETQIVLMHRRAETIYVPPRWFATAFAYLDEADSTFYYLEKCYDEGFSSILKVWPPFHRFRSDPRYTDLLRRMGLPE